MTAEIPCLRDGEHLEQRSLLILYATETGTAQDTADHIARECRRVHFHCRVCSMETYAPEELVSESLVVFVVATTGSGTEPRMMTTLWNTLLRSDLPGDLFEDMEFSVFGLGDSAYERFCWAAKKLSRRLSSLGAREICPRGEGDDQHQLGLDGALEPWVERLLDTLLQLYPLPFDFNKPPPLGKPPPRISTADVITVLDPVNPFKFNQNYFGVTVRCNRRITAEDWFQDVRHLELVSELDINYSPGDVVIIHPVVPDSEVEDFLSVMGWTSVADASFAVKHVMLDQSFPDHVPGITTLRVLFTHYLDFNAVPRRPFFSLLRHFARDNLEREKLDEFLSVEGADELYDYNQRVKRTIREVLADFRSARIPREYIFDLFPPLRPRQFSIASSVDLHPREIHLCVAIVKYRTKLKVPRKGVCTSYLAALRPGEKLRVAVQKGLVDLPADLAIPIVCVGPGTGIAPLRAIIEDRVQAGSCATMLFFGCRSQHKDQHYGAEWAKYGSTSQLTYRVAFSRDGPEGVSRPYVQDLLRKDGQLVWTLLGLQRGMVVVAGSSNKMPAAVRQALVDIAEEWGRLTRDDADRFVAEMERNRRLIEECWS